MNHLVRNMMFSGTTVTPATCTITSDESDFTDATPFEIQIVFDKAVTGFTVGDIDVGTPPKATLSNFAGSGTSYTADVTPLLNGDIPISVAENVTNEGNSASNVVSVTDNYVVPELGWYDSATFTTDISGAVITNNTAGNLSETIRSVVKYPGDGTLRYAEITASKNTAGDIVYSAVGFTHDEFANYLGATANTVGLWDSALYYDGGYVGLTGINMRRDDVFGLFCKGLDVWIYHYRDGIYIGGGNPYTSTTPTYTFFGGDIYIGGNTYTKDNTLTINTTGNFTHPPSSPAVPWDS